MLLVQIILMCSHPLRVAKLNRAEGEASLAGSLWKGGQRNHPHSMTETQTHQQSLLACDDSALLRLGKNLRWDGYWQAITSMQYGDLWSPVGITCCQWLSAGSVPKRTIAGVCMGSLHPKEAVRNWIFL